MPDKFLRVAEDSRLIVPIGRWALERACRDAVAWPDDADGGRREVWVNVSPHQLDRPDFIAMIEAALDSTGFPPDRLGIEITESCLVADAQAAATMLGSLRAMGVRIAIDDFGTGYSSLQWLQRLPVEVLKVDRSFVSELGEPGGRTAIVDSVITLAHGLGLKVVAEGVETEAQRLILIDLGCDAGQGYYFARPCSGPELWNDRRLPASMSAG
jgi:EAL domain-containing protein (putative c-di-GMP-specific phosphodiesterase class I)